MEVGQLCVKIAGRDAGRTAVVVEVVDESHVLLDGGVRRKKCNTKHVQVLNQNIDISQGADHAAVAKEFKKLALAVWETKPKKVSGEKPKKVRKQKEKVEKTEKSEKKKDNAEEKIEKAEVKKEVKEEKVKELQKAIEKEEKKEEMAEVKEDKEEKKDAQQTLV
jgi:large subunit ribosomal protein L14e